EHLDWQKADLDPKVICEVGSKSRVVETSRMVGKEDESSRLRSSLAEVTLKWSGKNVALRGWSEVEGLPQLPALKAITLNIPAMSDQQDPPDWIRRNLDQFKARLNQNMAPSGKSNSSSPRGIKVVENWSDKTPGASVLLNGLASSAGMPNLEQEHEWISDMERFAEPMSRLWESILTKSGEKLDSLEKEAKALSNMDTQTLASLQKLRKDAVVALIDDGVNTFDPTFSKRFMEGKTFDYRDDGVGQYYISETGHGTDMARMILKVCPMASIYSIKLKVQKTANSGESTVEAFSAASAIEAALEKKANIISMSWTLPKPDAKTIERERLDAVLSRACQETVLMFCSSPDRKSQNETQHYTSYFNRKKIFLIGAADDSGTLYNHSGTQNDFIFPGINISVSGDHNRNNTTSLTRELTGSSIATALAAGLAAMMTYCFKASALAAVMPRIEQGKILAASSTELIKPEDVNAVAHRDGIEMVFKRIGTIESYSTPFIPVWNRFRYATQVLGDEKKTDDQKSTYLMNLCRN
ncbi:peptidase S8/S53 domain-containing protein, partial [Fusarium tricinctum]